MDIEQYMRETPEKRWPLFLKEAVKRAQRTGRTVQEVLDQDVAKLRSMPVPDDEDPFVQ